MIFKEESYKPNLKTTNGLSFHGKTEYQGSFLEKEEKKEKKGDDKSELTLNQLQNFIIDL